MVREGLTSMVADAADMRVVAEAANGYEAVNLWRVHRPDVTLLDLRMPDLDGIAATEQIRASDGAARIVMVTCFCADEDIYRALRAGAAGYILKEAQREALLDCIRTVYGGELWVSPAVAAKLAGRLCGAALTNRETQVLSALSKGKSNKEIGAELLISETTVKSHVKNILAKLKVLNRTEAIAEASRRGFITL